MNLLAQSSSPSYRLGMMTLPISLTIKPACGVPGDYLYSTDSKELLRLLKLSTDLPATVLKKFEGDMHTSSSSKLLGVELHESVLEDLGYFVD